MSISLVVLFATLGADIGALFNYYLARWLGRPIVYRFANSRLGHMCLIDQEKVQKAEDYFDKHGAVSTFVGRLLPAIRQLISIPAGLARMKMGPFLLYTTPRRGHLERHPGSHRVLSLHRAGDQYPGTVAGEDQPVQPRDGVSFYRRVCGSGSFSGVQGPAQEKKSPDGISLFYKKTSPGVKKSRKHLERKESSHYICRVNKKNTMKNAVALIGVLLLPVVITPGSEKGA